MSCWLGDAAVAKARNIFESAGVATYETPEAAVQAFAMLATYRHNQEMLREVPAASVIASPDVAAARAIVGQALAEGRAMLNEIEAKQLLHAYPIPVIDTVAGEPNADAAEGAAERMGYPVALKILSPDISHKSDVGGVALGLRHALQVRQAVVEMLKRVAQFKPGARIAGFTVQSMVERPQAEELIIGASVDALFGPVLLFGHGGTAVEVLADCAMALPPLNRVLARELIARTDVAKLLAGYRNRAPANVDAIADVLTAVSQMLADLPEVVELDINPLWADHDGVLALDARVVLSGAKPGGAERFAIKPYPAELEEKLTWREETISTAGFWRRFSRRTCGCASSTRAGPCRIVSSPASRRSTMRARWPSSPSGLSPTAGRRNPGCLTRAGRSRRYRRRAGYPGAQRPEGAWPRDPAAAQDHRLPVRARNAEAGGPRVAREPRHAQARGVARLRCGRAGQRGRDSAAGSVDAVDCQADVAMRTSTDGRRR